MRPLRIFFSIILVAASMLKSVAQQDPMYSQYVFNMLAINPAYAGSSNLTSITGLNRTQWVGMRGAPTTQTLSFDTALPSEKVGLGIQVFNDKIGISHTLGTYASYAYRLDFGTSTLALGLQAGLTNYRADYSGVSTNTDNSTDNAFSENINSYFPNFGTGLFYNSEKFYFGLSLPHILNYSYNKDAVILTNEPIARQYLHLFVASGYVYTLNENFKLKPSVLVKGVKGAPLSVDLNGSVWIKDLFSVGAQYSYNSSLSGMFEWQVIPSVRIGYCYDQSTTRLANFNSGTHEVMLRYTILKNGILIPTPRYF